jgi:hypothetical protein
MTDMKVSEEMGRHREVMRHKRRELDLAPGRSPKLNAVMARINLRRMLAQGAGR